MIYMCDTECYANYWLIKFYDPVNNRTLSFEQYKGHCLDFFQIEGILENNTIVTFNGLNYDLPMITYAATRVTCGQLQEANDDIILNGLKYWEFYEKYELKPPYYIDHIDIREVAPGVGVSLKTYGARLCCPSLQDLPYQPGSELTPEEMVQVSEYCGKDLYNTYLLYKECFEAIELRKKMGSYYNLDLRSKSDAQIAEAIMRSRLGIKYQATPFSDEKSFKYEVPSFISFQSKSLKSTLNDIKNIDFTVSDGRVEIPEALKELKVFVGNATYKLGIGGLHSMEKSSYHLSSNGKIVSDHDVQSYYPSLILLCKMYPKQLGPRFLEIYEEIYNERIEAKQKGNKVESDSKKIILNGTFGKLGSKYSIMFAPELLIQVTITGQLCLLMLIESLELVGISVISANTDGIVITCPSNLTFVRDILIKGWERRTGLITEANFYRSIYCRDVNNYIAFKENGDTKTKGIFADTGVSKNPTNNICIQAVKNFLYQGIKISHTVLGCKEIQPFLTVRNVRGGAVKDGKYLGKVVRWYYGKGETGSINYASNQNLVAKSTGGVPLMDLTEDLPDDLHYGKYVEEAKEIIHSLCGEVYDNV